MTTATKITYTSASGNLDEFHQRFDVGLAAVRAAAGREHPASSPTQPGHRHQPAAGGPLADRHPGPARPVRGGRAGASSTRRLARHVPRSATGAGAPGATGWPCFAGRPS